MKIMISAGEASGDMHAASALQQLVDTSDEDIDAFGMGGKKLAAAGMQLIVDNEHHSVMGLIEVLKKYPQLRANLSRLKRCLEQRRPDVILLVDYPHFNMKLAATAKSLGIPVVYFIAPKVWASRPARLLELTRLVNHMAVILPFEVKIFEDANIPTTYVGNPLLDNTALIATSNAASKVHSAPTVALLPGSRKSEINNLLPTMLNAAILLKEKHKSVEFVLPVAETIDQSMIADKLTGYAVTVHLINANDYDSLADCTAAIVASGTATLELAILGVPMTVAYRMNSLSYAVVKRWLTIDHISLTNIIAEREVVAELIQDKATAEALFENTDQLLSDSTLYAKQKSELKGIYEKLGQAGASESLCRVLRSVVAKNTESGSSTSSN